MAAIDKIYGTRDQWIELFNFLKYNNPKYCRFLFDPPAEEGPISYFSLDADMWLYKNCELSWFQKALHAQYGGNLKKKYDTWEKCSLKCESEE